MCVIALSTCAPPFRPLLQLSTCMNPQPPPPPPLPFSLPPRCRSSLSPLLLTHSSFVLISKLPSQLSNEDCEGDHISVTSGPGGAQKRKDVACSESNQLHKKSNPSLNPFFSPRCHSNLSRSPTLLPNQSSLPPFRLLSQLSNEDGEGEHVSVASGPRGAQKREDARGESEVGTDEEEEDDEDESDEQDQHRYMVCCAIFDLIGASLGFCFLWCFVRHLHLVCVNLSFVLYVSVTSGPGGAQKREDARGESEVGTEEEEEDDADEEEQDQHRYMVCVR